LAKENIMGYVLCVGLVLALRYLAQIKPAGDFIMENAQKEMDLR